MQLIGMLDSPYVRRSAIALHTLGIAFELRQLSVFRDFDAFGNINPLVKAPTLLCADGSQLIDSNLIIDHAQSVAGRSLLPSATAPRLVALRWIGLALAACEKTVQLTYEQNLRPRDKQHPPWLDRVGAQLTTAYRLMERQLAERPAAHRDDWLGGSGPDLADISVAVAWGFTRLAQPHFAPMETYPQLDRLARRAEQLPAFAAYPPTGG